MFILHNKQIFFTPELKGNLPYTLKVQDLIVNDSLIIPLSPLYYTYFDKKALTFNEKRLPADVEYLYIKITKDKEILMHIKDDQNIYSINIPPFSSFAIDDNTKNLENLFSKNVEFYRKSNFDMSQILNDIYLKSVYVSKFNNPYILNLEDAFNLDINSLKRFVIKPKLKIFKLKDLQCIC